MRFTVKNFPEPHRQPALQLLLMLRPSAGTSLNETRPPNYSNCLNFLATFLVVTILNNDRLLVDTVNEVNLYGPTLSSLALPLFTPTYTTFHYQ